MSIFNITDITAAGAFCNAMDAAWESDRRAARRRVSAETGAAETPTSAAIPTALRRIAGLFRYSGPRHTAAATR